MIKCKIKTVMVSKTPSGKYYVSIMTECENQLLHKVPQRFFGQIIDKTYERIV